jgi:MFS family permease
VSRASRKRSISAAGWTQIILGALLMLATLPGRTQGLGLITEPLLADLHLDRVTYADLNLWATLLGALFCFPVGWAIDRLGLRWVTASVVLLLGLTVWRLSAVAAGTLIVFLLLLGTRAFGQSALSVCSINTVARWFPSKAGFAMGIYSVLLSVFFAIAFGGIGYAVRVQGWRGAWLDIAIALCFAITPLILLLMRAPVGQDGETGTTAQGPQFTLGRALRTSAFWVFAGSAAAFNLVSSGLGLFNDAVLAERGFDQKTFHIFLAVTTLLSLGGQFVCGWLSRRHSHQSLTSASMFIYAIAIAGIPFIHEQWQLWCLSLPIGCAGGMVVVIFFSVWGDLFGQQHLGRIQAAAQMLTVLSSGLGPVLFAEAAKRTGSYGSLLLAMAAVTFLLAIMASRTAPPTEMDCAPALA